MIVCLVVAAAGCLRVDLDQTIVYPVLVVALEHHSLAPDLHRPVVYPLPVVAVACRCLGNRFDGRVARCESFPMALMLAHLHHGSQSGGLVARRESRLAVVVVQAAEGYQRALRP